MKPAGDESSFPAAPMKYSKDNIILKSHDYVSVQIRRNAAQYLNSLHTHSD